MKNKIVYIAVLVGMFLFSSCEEFMDRDPQDKISNENLLSDIEGLKIAMIGCYRSLVHDEYYRRDLTLTSELRGGNIKITEAFTNSKIEKYVDIYGFNVVADNEKVKEIYEHIYGVLNQANNIINALPNVPDGTPEERDQILGEMYAVRALCHFDLLRLFAQPYAYRANAQHNGIVIVTKTPDVFDMQERATVYDSYKQVVEDLKAAIELTTEENKLGGTKKFWVGPVAAKALLAKVYVYMEDWNNAINYATQVLEEPGYNLVDGDLLLDEWSNNVPSSEDIWVLDNTVVVAASMSNYVGYTDVTNDVFCSVTSDLINLYEPGDWRLSLYGEFAGDSVTYKYQTNSNIENNIVVIRLAEMYLIRAEAYARTNQEALARSDLQVIRERADPSAGFVNLSGQDLIDEILLEKRREFALEGHIFFDLKRTQSDIVRNDCSATLNHNIEFPYYQYVFPIPFDNTEANRNIQQNEGY